MFGGPPSTYVKEKEDPISWRWNRRPGQKENVGGQFRVLVLNDDRNIYATHVDIAI